jgi:hypothetical protein
MAEIRNKIVLFNLKNSLNATVITQTYRRRVSSRSSFFRLISGTLLDYPLPPPFTKPVKRANTLLTGPERALLP